MSWYVSQTTFNALKRLFGRDDLSVAIGSLFDTVSDHVFKNISDENLPLLSYIHKAAIEKDFDRGDMEAVNKALYAIESFYRRNPNDREHDFYRKKICSRFAHHLLLENYEQLVQNYNRIMTNVRKHFPEFNLAQKGHNVVFGQDATIPCVARRCSNEDMETWSQKQDSFYTILEHGRVLNDENARKDLRLELEKFYADSSYEDGLGARAELLERVLGKLRSFPYGMEYMFNYRYYINIGYEDINDFLRRRPRSHRQGSIEDLSKSFTMFAANLALPFITTSDIVVYRGDFQKSSSEIMNVKGFLSTALSVQDTKKFAFDGGRILSIKIPKGTPVIPLSLHLSFECEILLLPGTRLKRVSRMMLSKGLFIEYEVMRNPPRLSGVEEATLFRNRIAEGYKIFEKTLFKDSVAATGLPTIQEIDDFNVDLVRKMY